MSKSPNSNSNAASREERLRAALRANLARRKAQGRARAVEDADGDLAGAQSSDQGGESTAGQTAEPRQE